MDMWIVMQSKSEKIGTERVYTDEYSKYIDNLRYYERMYEGVSFAMESPPVEPQEKYKTISVMFNIPRIIGLHYTDPIEKYADRLPNTDGWRWKNDLVWIEHIVTDNIGDVVDSYKLTFGEED